MKRTNIHLKITGGSAVQMILDDSGKLEYPDRVTLTNLIIESSQIPFGFKSGDVISLVDSDSSTSEHHVRRLIASIRDTEGKAGEDSAKFLIFMGLNKMDKLAKELYEKWPFNPRSCILLFGTKFPLVPTTHCSADSRSLAELTEAITVLEERDTARLLTFNGEEWRTYKDTGWTKF